MKAISVAILGALFVAAVGCGEEKTLPQAAVPATASANPLGGTASPAVASAPVPATPPSEITVPDSVSIEALLTDVKLDASPARNNRTKSVIKFALTPVQFSGGFREALDLGKASSLRFLSKHNDDCDKSTIVFSSMSPDAASKHELTAFDKNPVTRCNALFGNFKKDMRVVFENVPLVRNSGLVVPSVVLHMID